MYVTGDTHGSNSINKLSLTNFPQQELLTKDDYVAIAGDFGFVFRGSVEETVWLDRLQARNFTTLFVDGNHENFNLLNKYAVEDWHGGKVHKIRPNVIHLMRGQVFNIDDKTIFTFGGASSIDKVYRTEGLSWWPEEIPSKKEEDEGLANLDKADWKVDVVLTHSCPEEDHFALLSAHNLTPLDEPDAVHKYLSHIKKHLQYKRWFCGHYHTDDAVNGIEFLYDKVVRL